MKPFRKLPHIGSTRGAIERDVDEEIRFHLQMRIEDLMAQGRSRDEAEREAAREYGDTNAARSELTSIDRRAARQFAWSEWWSTLGQDVRFGLRGLRARPGFTATVLATLALGLGANVAIFSVVDATLLRPLPYMRPDRLLHLWEKVDGRVDARSEASYPDYVDWTARNKTLAILGGYHGAGNGFLVGAEQPTTVPGARVTANFFDVLGVRAAIGRTFAPGEDAIGAAPVVMITHGFWLRQFAGRRDIIGQPTTIDGRPVTIVGVLPQSFHFARQGDAQIWAPLNRGQAWRENRGNHWLKVVARLRDGASLEAAREDMSSVMKSLANEYAASNSGRGAIVVPLQEEFVGPIGPTLRLLFGAVLLVTLIACVNVANLLFMRGADRQREMAVRAALGAGRRRLVRQLLTESLLLAVCGGILGLGVAQLGVRSLIDLIPQNQLRTLPALAGAGLDPRVVGYALLVAIGAGVFFGITPALRLAGPAVHDTLKSAGRGTTGGATRLRDILVVGEIALTIVLMSGAVLFGRSLIRVLSIDPGFRSDEVVTMAITLPIASYRDAQSMSAFYDRFAERARQIPGVQSVAFTSKLPLDWGNSLGFLIAGQPVPEPSKIPTASYRVVSADYFGTLRIPLTAGRAFGAGDNASAPVVGVVNRAFVAAYLGAQDPVGQVLMTQSDTIRIVGVVGDVTLGKLEDKIPPTLYFSLGQDASPAMFAAIRTVPNARIATALREAAAAVDAKAAISNISTMETIITESPSVFMRRFPLFLVGAFAVTALLLAVVGIYGVVSYSVAQRSREMGIRMALGAPRKSVMTLVVRHGGAMALAGIALGVVAALVLGRFAESMLYGIRPNDPLTHISVSVILALVAVGATLAPARRATRVDPAAALRAE